MLAYLAQRVDKTIVARLPRFSWEAREHRHEGRGRPDRRLPPRSALPNWGALSATFGSGLTTIPGIAELSAAEQLAEIGDIGRYRMKAQFAMANGTAPLTAVRTASIGIVLTVAETASSIASSTSWPTRISRSPEGRAYTSAGVPRAERPKEVIRCLMRRISDRIFVMLRASVWT